jgi:hypothetical protein
MTQRYSYLDAENPPGGGSPSDTVASETSFGITPDKGAAASYSRGDHRHGTPSDPVTAHKTVTASVHNFNASGDAPAQSHGNSKHDATYITQAAVTDHAALTTGVHGVGGSTVDSASARDSAISSHNDLTGPHSAATNLEKTAQKGAASGYCGLDAGQKVALVNLGGSGADNTKYLRGDQTWQVPPGPPANLMQESLLESYPFGGTPTTLTPTTHTATKAYVFPFELDRAMTLNAVYIRTAAVLSNCLIIGIFNSAGTQVWKSGVLSTLLTDWIAVTSGGTPAFPVTLPAGTYYFVTTNNNVTSSTAAYAVTPVIGTGATLPRWGYVAATAGAMPSSITPAAITKSLGGWMCYVILSNVTS